MVLTIHCDTSFSIRRSTTHCQWLACGNGKVERRPCEMVWYWFAAMHEHWYTECHQGTVQWPLTLSKGNSNYMAENLPLTPNMEQYCRCLKKQHCWWSRAGCRPGTELLLNTRHCHPPSCTASTIITSWHPDDFTTTVSVTRSCNTSTTTTTVTACASFTSTDLDDSTHWVYYPSYTATSACLLCDTILPCPTLVCPLLLPTTHWQPIAYSIPTHFIHIWSSYCLSSSVLLTTPSSHIYLIQTFPAISTNTADYPPLCNYAPSVPISSLHSSRHIVRPTRGYCDHTSSPSLTRNHTCIKYESIITPEISIFCTVFYLNSVPLYVYIAVCTLILRKLKLVVTLC